MSQRIGSAATAFTSAWHHVDVASDKRTLGRLAASIAITLQGKHKPTYSPNRDHGDYVVVTNCALMKLTGNKLKEKTYWSHTTRPGSLKLVPMERMVANKGFGWVLEKAVKGMIPKNKLRLARLDRLKVFDGADHPYKENLIAFADEMDEVRARTERLAAQEAELAKLRKAYLKHN